MTGTPDNSAPVDHQDGGPGSHTDHDDTTNDVASGGTSEKAREEDTPSPADDTDVHGEPDTAV